MEKGILSTAVHHHGVAAHGTHVQHGSRFDDMPRIEKPGVLLQLAPRPGCLDAISCPPIENKVQFSIRVRADHQGLRGDGLLPTVSSSMFAHFEIPGTDHQLALR